MIIQKFDKNTAGRDFVVGDIHGCFAMLAETLDNVSFDRTKDRLFSVGDLVDRGPSSELALDWLAMPWFHAVRGNHEQMAIGVAAGRHDTVNYHRNGGAWFLDLPDAAKLAYAEVFDSLPYFIEVQTDAGRVGIVHAEITGGSWDAFVEAFVNAGSNNKRRELEEKVLWGRERIRAGLPIKINGLHAMYVGHTPVKEATTLGNVHYIDTGAVFGRYLTLVEIQNSNKE